MGKINWVVTDDGLNAVDGGYTWAKIIAGYTWQLYIGNVKIDDYDYVEEAQQKAEEFYGEALPKDATSSRWTGVPSGF